MNVIELEMVEILKKLRDDFGVFEVKAEFEAEGSRMEEMMRLKDVTSKADLPIILKIGGVEAITDIYNGLLLGVEGLITPMAETPFALSKFIDAILKFVPDDNREDIFFAANIETITAYKNFQDMLNLPKISLLQGVTIGRVDLTSSMGYGRDKIDSEEVFNICKDVFEKAKASRLKTALGGGVSTNSLDFIRRLHEMQLIDKFETRKIVFKADAVKYGEKAILKAVEFELLWLKSKRRYYQRIKQEDENRIDMLEKRLKL
jgi:4-hydroxy-2-oxoheptanedioate aldolase